MRRVGCPGRGIIAEVKIKLKRIKITKLPPKYDVENITDEYTVDVKNMFGGLQLEDREPGELWNDIREIVKDTADKMLSKAGGREGGRGGQEEECLQMDNK